MLHLRYFSFILCGLGIFFCFEATETNFDYEQDDEYREAALRILQEVPLIDGHNDWPWNLMGAFDGQLSQVDLDQDMCPQYPNPDTACHTDIPKLIEGMVGGQFWSCFSGCDAQYNDGIQKGLELIDVVKRFSSKYDYFFRIAYNSTDIQDAFNSGRMASLMGVEGGHMVSSSLATLRIMYEVGVRYMTLTWNCNTPWADNNDPEGDDTTPPHNGLTEWGKLLVVEMNRLGMLADLSHVSPDTMRDTLNVSLAPVIFSHSSVYGLCPHRRNVPDDVLLRLKDNGGVVMINFYNKFVNCTSENAYEPGYRSSNIDVIIDHMEYIKNMIGVEHIGLGSDFDGMSYVPDGLEDTSKYPNLVAQMLRRNWTEADVKQVVGLNILRVLEGAERVRDDLAQTQPQDLPIPDEDIPVDTCASEWSTGGSSSSNCDPEEEEEDHMHIA